jgi:ComF family protein
LAKEIWKEFALLIKPVVIEKLAYYSNLSGKLFLQPIPLSKKRLRDRGFNQAFFLCKYFQKFLTLPISDFIIRVKDTKSQAELKNKRERYNNLRGAFKINDHGHPELILGSRIVLVDDVITSGSTVKEAAKILKKFGAIKIYILALAKG